MTFPSLLGLLTLVVGVPLNLYVTFRLWQLHKLLPENRVVREREITAAAVLVLTAVFAFIFWNNDRIPPLLSSDETRIVTRLTLLVVAVVPAMIWLSIYTERRDDDPSQTSIDAHTTALDANTQAMADNTQAMADAAETPTDVHVVQNADDPAVRVKPDTETPASDTDRIVAAIEYLPGQGGAPQDVTVVQPADHPVPVVDAGKQEP